MPRVSVLIPAYNAARYLPASLNSVLHQTFSSWEIILVDDGSQDGTRTLVESLLPQFGDRLRYVYQENRGLPAARNTALRHASGEYIAILDADDVWLPERLEKSVACLDRHPEAGLAHSRVVRIDSGGRLMGEPAAPPARFLAGRIAEHLYTRRAHILCPTVTFRFSCLEKSGNFDETLRATEDRDLWFRIASHYPVVYINEVLAQYRVSAGSMSQDLDRMRNAQLQFLEKHRGSSAIRPGAYRQALAGISRERGDALFGRGLKREALACYFESVRLRPFAWKNLYMLVRASADPAIARLRPAATPQRAKSA